MASIDKLSVLIPAFNEIRTIEALLTSVANVKLPCAAEIIVVDDGSTDGTREVLEDLKLRFPQMRVFFHDKNLGKGAAIRTAIAKATGDWTIIQDADLEYDPRDYVKLLEPVLDDVADVVFGSRFLVGKYARAMLFWHTVANKCLTLATNVVTNLNLTDMETCYKLVRTSLLKSIILRSSGFDLEPELTIKLARTGARIYEVPISYRGRTYAEGKKIGPRDAAIALYAIFRYRFFDARYFSHDGFLILQSISRAKRFNRWLFDQFSEHLGDSVLEVGCGIGTLTQFVLNKKRIVAIDLEKQYVDRVRVAYGHLNNVKCDEADVTDSGTLQAAIEQIPVDSAFCINVLEHIEDDVLALKNLSEVIKPGGNLVILVPHNPKLYSPLDEVLGHYRRYEGPDLAAKMEDAGFTVHTIKKFNRVGALGWRVSAKWFGKKTISVAQMRVFELLMPLIRLAEHVPFETHNSVICIGMKR